MRNHIQHKAKAHPQQSKYLTVKPKQVLCHRKQSNIGNQPHQNGNLSQSLTAALTDLETEPEQRNTAASAENMKNVGKLQLSNDSRRVKEHHRSSTADMMLFKKSDSGQNSINTQNRSVRSLQNCSWLTLSVYLLKQ